MEVFSAKLGELILRVRDLVCANADNGVTKEAFRCYLVAHSMGGLVCRGLLQNPKNDKKGAAKYVDKFFTYATPHNGIDMAGINVPSWLSKGDMNNFNRERMTEYLDLKSEYKKTGDGTGSRGPVSVRAGVLYGRYESYGLWGRAWLIAHLCRPWQRWVGAD